VGHVALVFQGSWGEAFLSVSSASLSLSLSTLVSSLFLSLFPSFSLCPSHTQTRARARAHTHTHTHTHTLSHTHAHMHKRTCNRAAVSIGHMFLHEKEKEEMYQWCNLKWRNGEPVCCSVCCSEGCSVGYIVGCSVRCNVLQCD